MPVLVTHLYLLEGHQDLLTMPFETAHAYGKAGPALYRTSYPCRTFMLEWAVADGSRSLRILVGLRFFQFRLQLHYIMMHLGLDAVASIDTPTAARPGCQSSSFPCIPWKGCKLSGSCIEVRVNPHALVYCRPSGFLSHCSRHEIQSSELEQMRHSCRAMSLCCCTGENDSPSCLCACLRLVLLV